MNLKSRLAKLEEQLPACQRRPVPTELGAFAAGFLAGEFGIEDVDHTDYAQTQVFYAFAIRALVANSPEHRAYLATLQRPVG